MTPYFPLSINSSLKDLKITPEVLYWYPWIPNLKNKNSYLFLNQPWSRNGGYPLLPPSGYDYYITSGDSLMFGLPEYMVSKLSGKIIHLTGCIIEDNFNNNRIEYVPYNTAHMRLNRYKRLQNFTKQIAFKASALTNRVTQSKAIIFAALMHHLGEKNCAVSLHHNLYHTKNVHNWTVSGNEICDYFLKIFLNQHKDKNYSLCVDDGDLHGYNNIAYQQSALNFTQESYHYSFTMDGDKCYVQPGPFLTEKTWKCIISSTAFIPVGQCYAYRWLKSLGLQFDYGPLNLKFDEDPGNLTRLEKIIQLIESLQEWSAQEIYEFTKTSTQHNTEYVQSAEFWKRCEASNTDTYSLLANLT
jgi:hypothetical protein